MIDMNETQAQRDADRIREHAPMLLAALQKAVEYLAPRLEHAPQSKGAALLPELREAIEYATGAHDQASYPKERL